MSEHDHILLNMNMGRHMIFLRDIDDLSWPPPERIISDEGGALRPATDDDDPKFVFKRLRMSQLTDEQIEKCPGVARGAEYEYENQNG